mgnify:CR=1 FL=1
MKKCFFLLKTQKPFNLLSPRIKEMKKIYLISWLIFVIIAGLLYITLRLDLDEPFQKMLPKKTPETSAKGDIVISRPAGVRPQEAEDDESEENNGIIGGGEGDKSKSNSQQQSPCYRTIAYTMQDFNKQEDCLIYQGTDCINKTVNCSVAVQNLDFEMGGEFTVKFDFKESSTEDTIYSTTESNQIPPREKILFSKEQKFSFPESNKMINCQYSTQNAPQKYLC